MTSQEAFDVIHTHRVRGIGLVDADGVLVGSLSATDLRTFNSANIIERFDLPIHMFAKMGDLVTCVASASVWETISIFHHKRVHRLFVVDADNKPVGMFSLTDLHKTLASVV